MPVVTASKRSVTAVEMRSARAPVASTAASMPTPTTRVAATTRGDMSRRPISAARPDGAPRAPPLPDVPTMAELGLPQLGTSVWFGLAGPKNLPPAITERLTAAHQQMLATPEFKTRMAAAGLNASPDICGAAFLAKMNQESERWARIVKATGFSAVE